MDRKDKTMTVMGLLSTLNKIDLEKLTIDKELSQETDNNYADRGIHVSLSLLSDGTPYLCVMRAGYILYDGTPEIKIDEPKSN